MHKITQWLRLTPNALFVIMIFLLVVDLAVRFHWAGLYENPGNLRLVNEELASLQVMKELIEKEDGYKVVFLGDSQTYGSAVKSGTQTIPAYLQKELRLHLPKEKVKVFNFAFKGYGISENYFLLEAIKNSDVDLVIYNLGTGWFNRAQVLEHSNVVPLSGYLNPGEFKSFNINTRSGLRERATNTIDFSLGKIWAFYRYRSDISAALAGKPLREVFTDVQLGMTNPSKLKQKRLEEAQLYQPWRGKDWNQILTKVTSRDVGYLNLTPDNPQVFFYNKIISLLTGNKTRAVVYTSPQNFSMFRKYYRFNEQRWQENIQKIGMLTENRYVDFFDYSSLVPDQYFSDTVHMNSEGNRLVARVLADHILRTEVTWKQ